MGMATASVLASALHVATVIAASLAGCGGDGGPAGPAGPPGPAGPGRPSGHAWHTRCAREEAAHRTSAATR